MKDPVSHLTFYGTPGEFTARSEATITKSIYSNSARHTTTGIAQTTLSGMGCCMVLSDLNIPLLWMQIASSGMNKVSEPINLVVF